MSAKDAIHGIVKNALIKDGWTITADPYTIIYEGESLYADLAAERPIAAERAGRRIIVEVKSFTGPSIVQDFKNAWGQYMLYRMLLRQTRDEHKLYLAISDYAYATATERATLQLALDEGEIPLIVVNVEQQEIVKWVH
jgi:hypothetical protein